MKRRDEGTMTRQRVLSIRIGVDERTAWGRAATASDSRWIAQWVRATMDYAIVHNRCAFLRAPADADANLVAHVHSLALTLNEETRAAHVTGVVSRDIDRVATALLDAVSRAAPRASSAVAASSHVKQSELINVRLSEDELQHWMDLSHASGFSRPATWVRYTIAALLGIKIPSMRRPTPDGIQSVRFDLAGAVTNFSQLRDVAENLDPTLAHQMDDYGLESVRLLAFYRDGGD